MEHRSIELDRDYRRQVRKAYYLCAEDFVSEREYNDYLEEVEDLVEELVNEQTRPAARRRLDELRAKWSVKTSENLAKYDQAKMQREDAIEREHAEQQRAAQARQEAKEAEERLKMEKRNALHQGISAGRTSVQQARADMRSASTDAHAAAAATVAAASTAGPLERAAGAAAPASSSGDLRGGIAPLVKPIDPEVAKAVMARIPEHMVRSLLAEPEAYESDPKKLRRVRVAGGDDPELWRMRYRMEAGLSLVPASR